MSGSHTPLESLKQWELVEDDRGLQVIEKRAGAPSPIKPKEATIPGIASPLYEHRSTPVSGRRLISGTSVDASLEEKLRVFNQSKIIQPIGLPLAQQRELAPSLTEPKSQPLSLDLILKQQQQQQRTSSTTAESTDMLQRLEQQVKAIEMSTIAARRQLGNSSDFGPEVQLRYREHEDLLRNVTDDEADG